MASREQKARVIAEIEKSLAKADICILAEYRGLTAPEMTDLRRKLRESGIEFKVVKNTLGRFAAERAGKGELAKLLNGPIAVAFGFGEVTVAAKVLTEYARTQKIIQIKGGCLGNKLLTVQDIAEITALPSREVLLAKVIGGVQSPIVSLVTVLNGPVRGLMTVLQGRIKQLEGQGAGAS